MSALILRRAIRLTGKRIPRFSPEPRCMEVDPPDTFPAEEFIPQFAHPTGGSSSLGNRANICSPEAMTMPSVTTSQEIPPKDPMKPLISTPEGDTDNEDDQESHDAELVIPKTAPRKPRTAEESLALYHRPSDASTLLHE
jgi:hypothetical protein